MPYTPEQLTSLLSHLCQKRIRLTLNRNTSSYVKVTFRKPISVSLHQAFLEADEKVIKVLASYIMKNRIDKEIISNFMIHYLSTHYQPPTVFPKGEVYDLDLLYNDLNERFFDNSLSLLTTWWKMNHVKNRSSCTLGLFLEVQKLIKIHSVLDKESVPQYVVESVLFHEMLHAASPARRDSRGRRIAHHPEFRQREKLFPFYEKADHWLKENRPLFFRNKSR